MNTVHLPDRQHVAGTDAGAEERTAPEQHEQQWRGGVNPVGSVGQSGAAHVRRLVVWVGAAHFALVALADDRVLTATLAGALITSITRSNLALERLHAAWSG